MADLRVRVPLNGKTVNLAQLSSEVGEALSGSDVEVVVADEQAPVTAEQLQSAVDAHTPVAPFDVVAAVQASSTLAELRSALVTHFQEA